MYLLGQAMSCWSILFQSILCLILMDILKCDGSRNNSLVLVHVIFSHGEKMVAPDLFNPNNSYINETFHPLRINGQLTLSGKRQMYRLGKKLRKQYDTFLDDEDLLEAQSSDADVARMSMELVLAGLFPPTEEQKVDASLNWQPILYKSVPMSEDNIFFGSLCPNYKKYLKVYMKSRKMRAQFSEHQDIMKYLAEAAGKNITNFLDVFRVYEYLNGKDKLNFTLPQWSQKVYPEPMREVAVKSYQTETGTVNLRRLTAGYLLQKIVETTKNKLLDLKPATKMHLYAGHPFNIAHLLILLEIFDQEIPPYGSYISLEVHQIDGVDGVKIFYGKNDEGPSLVTLPYCEAFCPMEKFSAIAEEYRPPRDLCQDQESC